MTANSAKHSAFFSHRAILWLAFMSIFFSIGVRADNQEILFIPLTSADGLSDNNVRSISQLADGRMIFVTSGDLNIYDGASFGSFDLFPAHASEPLKKYTGHHHLYVEKDSLLWIKNSGKFTCFDLTKEHHIAPSKIPESMAAADDMFIDDNGERWTRNGDSLFNHSRKRAVGLLADDGELQDVAADANRIYLFFNSGRVVIHSLSDFQRLSYSDAYDESKFDDYSRTSLVAPGPNGIYQIRKGKKGGLFFFNTEENAWRQLMETDYPLNMLTITKSGIAYITCNLGLWIVDLNDGHKNLIKDLRTTQGNIISTNVSTIFEDHQGAVWLGTHNRGLLYGNPALFETVIVATSEIPDGARIEFIEDYHGQIYVVDGSNTFLIEGNHLSPSPAIPESRRTRLGRSDAFVAADGAVYFRNPGSIGVYKRTAPSVDPSSDPAPILSSIKIHGEELFPDSTFEEEVKLTQSIASTKKIALNHNQNFLTLEFHLPRYGQPCASDYRYILEGFDSKWTTAKASGNIARIHYTNIPPGRYLLRVAAYSPDSQVSPDEKVIEITVRPPWWRTKWAIVVYILVALFVLAVSFRVHSAILKKKMERRHREEILLTRIRDLIEQCQRLEQEKEESLHASHPEAEETADIEEDPPETITAAENEFIVRAIRLVESNLNTPGYNVEQLSRDLCMERTGLYKKLSAILDQTPSLFIRNIRLRRAAELLTDHPSMTIAEIAERTGFSSGSYLSKCFQDVYGCRPSEYVKHKNSGL